jgi:hypothetical protein
VQGLVQVLEQGLELEQSKGNTVGRMVGRMVGRTGRMGRMVVVLQYKILVLLQRVHLLL